jgi:glycosyltransferase involved in cell wall biosynthesis
MKIPIIINNRNLLTWPSKMVEDLQTFENVGEIIILDNGSTYEPLLEWYKTNPCTIIYSENLGQGAPWILNLPNKLGFDYYVVTDSDLDLSKTPKNSLLQLKEKLDSHLEYSKIGLSLYNWNVSEESPYHHFLKTWGLNNWGEDTIIDGLLTKQLVDTTFALYHIDRHPHGHSCATNLPYSARHIPWEITKDIIQDMPNKNFEFYNYLLNATNASSYKSFISFNTIYG